MSLDEYTNEQLQAEFAKRFGQVFPIITIPSRTGNCDLCMENDASDTTCRPYVCKYCSWTGGGLGIGSRQGSKKNYEEDIKKVHKPIPYGNHTNVFSLYGSDWGLPKESFNRAYIRGSVIYTGVMTGMLDLPQGVDSTFNFCTFYDGCMACKFTPTFVTPTRIKFGEDDLERNKGSLYTRRERTSLGVFKGTPIAGSVVDSKYKGDLCRMPEISPTKEELGLGW